VAFPPLLSLGSAREYKKHYESRYQRGEIRTFDGIRVYFKPQKFGHAFYENSERRAGVKDEFSTERAERMDWIRATLEHPDAKIYEGWNKAKKCYDETRRVSVVYADFVVVIECSLSRNDELKANFVTCYVADRSIDKIRTAPDWDKLKCLNKLKK